MGLEVAARPDVTVLTKCKLRVLKWEKIKDYLLMEEFVRNEDRLKPWQAMAWFTTARLCCCIKAALPIFY
ncbi:hypothetical protein NL676_012850 [Syzygium grande]|nr:hypothetical protein NL676_012850 [Syzygium grande]